MNCPSCNTPIAATDRFCPACGTDVMGRPRSAPPPPPAAALNGHVPEQARNWALAAHAGGLALALVSATAIGFVAPMLVLLLKRDEHPFIEEHAREALNFQLTVLMAAVVAMVLAIPAVIIGILTFGIGLLVFALIALIALALWFVLPVIGSVKAANGERYRYPATIRFVR